MPVPLRFVVTLEPAPGTFSFATKTLIVEGGVIHLGTAGIGMNPPSSPVNGYFECDHATEKFAFLFSPGDGNVRASPFSWYRSLLTTCSLYP